MVNFGDFMEMRLFLVIFNHCAFFTDAKALASTYDCKYTETSGALNHNVDELLVGILKQIRLKSAEKSRNLPGHHHQKKHLMRLGTFFYLSQFLI